MLQAKREEKRILWSVAINNFRIAPVVGMGVANVREDVASHSSGKSLISTARIKKGIKRCGHASFQDRPFSTLRELQVCVQTMTVSTMRSTA